MSDPFTAVFGPGRGSTTVNPRWFESDPERRWQWSSDHHPELSAWLADRGAKDFDTLTIWDTPFPNQWTLEATGTDTGQQELCELDGGAVLWLVDNWPKALVWIDDVHDAGDHVSGWLTHDAARQAGDL